MSLYKVYYIEVCANDRFEGRTDVLPYRTKSSDEAIEQAYSFVTDRERNKPLFLRVKYVAFV